jgi:hypothetical protein
VPVYDGGINPRPEDECEEESWADPLDGELPGRPPRTAEDVEEWQQPKWGGTPEEQMFRELLEDDDEDGS